MAGKSKRHTLSPSKERFLSDLKTQKQFCETWQHDHGHASMERCLAPPVKASGDEGKDHSSIERLMLAPLSWVVHASKPIDPSAELPVLGGTIGECLSMMEDDPPSKGLDTPTSLSIDPGNESVVTPPALPAVESRQVVAEGSGTKKKKKNRKKNVKIYAVEPSLEETAVQVPEPEAAVIPVKVDGSKAKSNEEIEEQDASEKKEEVVVPLPPLELDETEVTVASVAQEVVSVKSDASDDRMTVADGSSASVSGVGKGDIAVSRVQGYLVVAAPIADNTASLGKGADGDAASPEGKDAQEDDGDAWETVGARGRGNRRRVPDKGNQSAPRQNSSGFVAAGSGGQHDSNVARRGEHNRSVKQKKEANGKMVKEIIPSILDSVDEEIKRKRQQSVTVATVGNAWKTGPPGVKAGPKGGERQDVAAKTHAEKKEKTLRDVLMGTHVSTPKKALTVNSSPTEQRLARVDEKSKMHESSAKKHASPLKPAGLQREEGNAADQNTAPTYQETVSAVSIAVDTKELVVENPLLKSDSSFSDTDDAPRNKERQAATSDKNASPTPPLPTLLSPENANSATSSVASSLEAPHAGPRHHHSNSAVDVNDVGYHLLDVCDRLSRDMSLFMNRRALALKERRRERGALLVALQDTVSSLWPERCHVEMYGSCATQLDLPSSDLDVVILGLDRNLEMMLTPVTPQTVARSKSVGSESLTTAASIDESSALDECPQSPDMQRHVSVPPFVPMAHRNAERVLRLATTLETLPWAVQVNAIPTASVPVVKVLADPSKLEAPSKGGDGMSHHQHLATQAAAAAPGHSGPVIPEEAPSVDGAQTGRHQYHQPGNLLPWRGCDVMNGLLKLDITFEGPEHGGIGSTEFSASAVAEMSYETGLHPDATAFVQVLMVIKELLAQRKLNEPYSGGLSSYALLLLLVALMKERAVIREELDRVERQKRAMNTDVTNSFASSSTIKKESSFTTVVEQEEPASEGKEASMADKFSSEDETLEQRVATPKALSSTQLTRQMQASVKTADSRIESQKSATAQAKISAPKKKGSSWASIARKNTSIKQTPETIVEENTVSSQLPKPKGKSSSFVDVVGRSIQTKTLASRNNLEGKADSKKNEASPTKKEPQVEPSPQPETTWRRSASQSSSKAVVATAETEKKAIRTVTPPGSNMDSSITSASAFFPQGFNDVIEVLCSGETTAGKLLMHFFLFYGEHFDAQSTAIDISGKHERDDRCQASSYSHLSPYIQRRAPGSFDPVTGMWTVDPIVIYDPLEGTENNNVSKRCFAWTSVRWIFAQSYATLSSAVERSATPPATPGATVTTAAPATLGNREVGAMPSNPDGIGDLMDPSSPLLRCLLSF